MCGILLSVFLLAAPPGLSTPESKSPLARINEIHVINNDPTSNQLESFVSQSGLTREQFRLVAGIDHRTIGIDVREYISNLFKENQFGSETKIMVRALNHLNTWRHIAVSHNPGLHLVVEDFSEFESDWMSKWNEKYAADLPRNTFVYLFVILVDNVRIVLTSAALFTIR
jgi:hypothetical protein